MEAAKPSHAVRLISKDDALKSQKVWLYDLMVEYPQLDGGYVIVYNKPRWPNDRGFMSFKTDYRLHSLFDDMFDHESEITLEEAKSRYSSLFI